MRAVGAGAQFGEVGNAVETIVVAVVDGRQGGMISSIILLGADDDAFDVDTPLVMQTLRLTTYRPRFPVILYTANPDAKAREMIEGAPDVLSLPTPFTAERLLQAVRDDVRGTTTDAALT